MAKGRTRPPRLLDATAKKLLNKAESISKIHKDVLPHEWLQAVVSGFGIEQVYRDEHGNHHTDIVYPSIDVRMDAAKAAAPFFAPRLSSQKVDTTIRKYEDLTDEELEEALRAAQDEQD